MNGIRNIALLTCLTFLPAGPCQAQDSAGTMEELVRRCEGRFSTEETVDGVVQNTFMTGFCHGYISGILSFNSVVRAIGENALFCVPDQGISVEQGLKVFLKYAEDHPEWLHENSRIHVAAALRLAFPCD